MAVAGRGEGPRTAASAAGSWAIPVAQSSQYINIKQPPHLSEVNPAPAPANPSRLW